MPRRASPPSFLPPESSRDRMETTRVLICDPWTRSRTDLRAALSALPGIEIVGEAPDGEMAVALAGALAPDAVVIDPRLAGAVDATGRIRTLLPEARLVALTPAVDQWSVGAMLEAGADAYCVKGAPLWELERAISGAADPLLRLAHGLSRAVTAAGVAELVARELAELTGAVAAVYLAAPDVGISLAALAGAAERGRLATAPGIALRSFREGALVQANPTELAVLAGTGIAVDDALAAPLLHNGEALGAIFTAIPEGVRLRVDPELVSAVADLAASAVATERRLALTHAEARRDSLTGLPNRRAFDERLEAGAGEIAVALIDVDDFKEINDRRGHPAGDAVLRELARIAQRAVRATDEVYRIGGDELAIVVPGGASDVVGLVNRIRTRLARHRRNRALPTVSAGVSASPGDAASRDELIAHADSALYAAKRGGKDRVVAYAPGLAGESGATSEGSRDEGGPARGTLALVGGRRPRVLVVDDDQHLRELLRMTLGFLEADVDECATAADATARIASWRPDVVVLDVGLPDGDGLVVCRQLKDDPATADAAVIVLTGADAGVQAQTAGADAFLRKPFSPLELLSAVERLAHGRGEAPVRAAEGGGRDDQLLLYAEDLRRLLEVELSQRELLQRAYRETVTALAVALESKDIGTGAHSQRVQRYAVELAWTMSPALLDDPGVEYGFLLHDVGKIGIPDSVLRKPGPLLPAEWRLIRNHTILGEQMLGGVALLEGEGLRVVRSHHERWDGRGYPDSLAGTDIPLGARIFAVADALDAMTTDRPYRAALGWDAAAAEIARESSYQFDPDVAAAFDDALPRLQAIQAEFVGAA